MKTLYQWQGSTADVAGAQDLSQLLSHGNFGLGTFAATEGELLVLDGSAYRATASDEAIQVQELDATQLGDSVAIATVCDFGESALDKKFALTDSRSLRAVEAGLRAELLSDQIFHAIEIIGFFDQVKVRLSRDVAPSGDGLSQEPARLDGLLRAVAPVDGSLSQEPARLDGLSRAVASVDGSLSRDVASVDESLSRAVASVDNLSQEPARLDSLSRLSREAERRSVSGTIIGFYTPERFGSLSAPGFRLYFLSRDRNFGGQVTECSSRRAVAGLIGLSRLILDLPTVI